MKNEEYQINNSKALKNSDIILLCKNEKEN